MSTRSRWQSYAFGGTIIVVSTTATPDTIVEAFGFGGFLTASEVIGFAFWGLLWALVATIGDVWSYFSRRLDRWPLEDARWLSDVLKHNTIKERAVSYHNEPINPVRLAEAVDGLYSELLSLDNRPDSWKRRDLFIEASGVVARLQTIAQSNAAFGLSTAQRDRIQSFATKWKKLKNNAGGNLGAAGILNFAYASSIAAVAFALSIEDGISIGIRVACHIIDALR